MIDYLQVAHGGMKDSVLFQNYTLTFNVYNLLYIYIINLFKSNINKETNYILNKLLIFNFNF